MNHCSKTVTPPRQPLASTPPRQLGMTFASTQLRGMTPSDRVKTVAHLASLLILAAGLEEGECDDDDV